MDVKEEKIETSWARGARIGTYRYQMLDSEIIHYYQRFKEGTFEEGK